MRIFGFCAGDDARENGDFQIEKQRLQGTKFLRAFKNLMGAMLMKIVILLKENESHMAKNSVF